MLALNGSECLPSYFIHRRAAPATHWIECCVLFWSK